jgi:hypothetical protein
MVGLKAFVGCPVVVRGKLWRVVTGTLREVCFNDLPDDLCDECSYGWCSPTP